MPLIQTQGAASVRSYGENLKTGAMVYIEDVFSTYLYTGTGATQTITNGIDLSTKGGLVWIKQRSGTQDHTIFDTSRGVNNYLRSNSTGAQNPGGAYTDLLTAYNTTGFSLGADASTAGFVNASGSTYVSWSFEKQPKFFDIVTYTGNGANRTIAHNLGSVPGCIFVKRTDTTANWQVYHRSLTNTQYLVLNSDAVAATGATRWNSTTPTSSVFSLGTDTTVNASGGTYVAYIFAHDAGGFGNAGTDNVISCGSFVTDGSGNATVTLGYEPQWVLIKESVAAASYGWILLDNMRGWSMSASDNVLYANLTNAESTFGGGNPTATGFVSPTLVASSTYIYIAIRRGPMKTPTVGTSVFGLNARTGTGAIATVTGGQTDDAVLIKNRGAAVASLFSSRLTSINYLVTSTTAAEVAAGTTILQANPWDVMDGVKVGTTSTITNASANTFINYLFRRAPGFFDVVCYTGTGANATQTHNLGVVPELIIVKGRSGTSDWQSYASILANTEYLVLNTTAAKATGATRWNSTTPTSSVFSLGTATEVNTSSATYVAYLFATLAGISKIGSYTGTAALLTVNCGFTAGARFVLIKRTDSTGDWYIWDSTRGITGGNDPYLLLNSAAAEATTTNYVDTDTTGFKVTAAAPAALNASGGTYLFLAIA
jgi:hypothetical protein